MDEQTVLMSRVLQCVHDKCVPGDRRNCSNVRNRPKDAAVMVRALYRNALEKFTQYTNLEMVESACHFVNQIELIYARYAQRGADHLMSLQPQIEETNEGSHCEDWRIARNRTLPANRPGKIAYATQ